VTVSRAEDRVEVVQMIRRVILLPAAMSARGSHRLGGGRTGGSGPWLMDRMIGQGRQPSPSARLSRPLEPFPDASAPAPPTAPGVSMLTGFTGGVPRLDITGSAGSAAAASSGGGPCSNACSMSPCCSRRVRRAVGEEGPETRPWTPTHRARLAGGRAPSPGRPGSSVGWASS